MKINSPEITKMLEEDMRSYLKDSAVFTKMPDDRKCFADAVKRYVEGLIRIDEMESATRRYFNERARAVALYEISPRLESLQTDVSEFYKDMANTPARFLKTAIEHATPAWEMMLSQMEAA